MIARPHDALFRAAFADPAAASALLRALLPAAIRDAIDWDTLEGQPASFVDPALVDRHGDLVFAARLRTAESASVGFLLEHQSRGDPVMPLRALNYEVQIWNRVHRNQPAAWLSPILAVLLSHVPGGWTMPRSFEALFEPAAMAIPELAATVPRCSLIVEDLTQRSNADLQALSLAAFPKLALWLLRDARDPARLLSNFDAWIDTFVEVERAPSGDDALRTLLTYLFHVVDPMHHDALRAKLRPLGARAENITMTIVEQWLEEGRKEGLEKGLARGREEGREEGLVRGRHEGQLAALHTLLVARFGDRSLRRPYAAILRDATPEDIDGYLRRAATAETLIAVFED